MLAQVYFVKPVPVFDDLELPIPPFSFNIEESFTSILSVCKHGSYCLLEVGVSLADPQNAKLSGYYMPSV